MGQVSYGWRGEENNFVLKVLLAEEVEVRVEYKL